MIAPSRGIYSRVALKIKAHQPGCDQAGREQDG
jgi:hypothetical protein